MKRFRKFFPLLSGALFLLLLLFISATSPPRFRRLCDTVFQEEMSGNSLMLHYTVSDPKRYGIDESSVTLGTENRSLSDRLRLLYRFLSLQTIARGRLEKEDQKTFDLLQYTLGLQLEQFRFEHLAEPLTPSTGIQSQLPVLLAEYTFRNEQDIKNYLSLLSCVPEYFDSIIAAEQKKLQKQTFMDRETAGELIRFCRQFCTGKNDHFLAETFAERLETLKLPASVRESYLAQNNTLLETKIFPAYERLAAFLEKHQASGSSVNGLSGYKDGADYYRWLLRSEIGTEEPFEQIEQTLDHALAREIRTISALAKAHPALLKKKQQIFIDSSDPSALTKLLAAKTARDFPVIENVQLTIRNVPDSLEPHLSPAFYLIPPVDDWKENVVYLNQASLTNSLSFFTTLAHETYPGHLCQTVFEYSRSPHPVRRLLYFGGYTEGWATYAEQLSYFYAPVSKELAALLSATRAMTLNLYSHLDLYVHAYGWDEGRCRDYLKKFGITDQNAVHEMFLLIKQQPSNYLKYYLGYLEICKLKKEAQTVLKEQFQLKEFHEFLLNCGPMPFTMLEKELEEWLHSSGSFNAAVFS